MKNGRIQAKDIPDVEFLAAVLRCQIRKRAKAVRRSERADYLPWANWAGLSASGDSVKAVAFRREFGPFVDTYFPAVPGKVLRAKGQRLIDRGLMTGCMCGCRGDMEITAGGIAFLIERCGVEFITKTVVLPASIRLLPGQRMLR